MLVSIRSIEGDQNTPDNILSIFIGLEFSSCVFMQAITHLITLSTDFNFFTAWSILIQLHIQGTIPTIRVNLHIP